MRRTRCIQPVGAGLPACPAAKANHCNNAPAHPNPVPLSPSPGKSITRYPGRPGGLPLRGAVGVTVMTRPR